MKHVPSLEPIVLMISLETCERCGRPSLLFARIAFDRLCSTCWKALPEIRRWPGPTTMHEAHEAEVRARDAMQRRGGADRHLVRAGLS